MKKRWTQNKLHLLYEDLANKYDELDNIQKETGEYIKHGLYIFGIINEHEERENQQKEKHYLKKLIENTIKNTLRESLDKNEKEKNL